MISENIDLKARILRFLKTCFPSVRKEVSNWPKCSFRLLRKLLWEYPKWSLKTQANFLASPIVSWLLSFWFCFVLFFLLLVFILGLSARSRWLGRSLLRILVSWVAITDDHKPGTLMQQKHCLSSGGPKSSIKVLAGLAPPESSDRDAPSCLSTSLWFLGLWVLPASLCFYPNSVLLCVCICDQEPLVI